MYESINKMWRKKLRPHWSKCGKVKCYRRTAKMSVQTERWEKWKRNALTHNAFKCMRRNSTILRQFFRQFHTAELSHCRNNKRMQLGSVVLVKHFQSNTGKSRQSPGNLFKCVCVCASMILSVARSFRWHCSPILCGELKKFCSACVCWMCCNIIYRTAHTHTHTV